METVTLLTRVESLISAALVWNCPKLSGNMQAHISSHPISPRKILITISAPSYDLARWRATGQVVYDGKYNYALSVNKFGAFMGKSKRSAHWVDRTLNSALITVASMFNAEVIKEI